MLDRWKQFTKDNPRVIGMVKVTTDDFNEFLVENKLSPVDSDVLMTFVIRGVKALRPHVDAVEEAFSLQGDFERFVGAEDEKTGLKAYKKFLSLIAFYKDFINI